MSAADPAEFSQPGAALAGVEQCRTFVRQTREAVRQLDLAEHGPRLRLGEQALGVDRPDDIEDASLEVVDDQAPAGPTPIRAVADFESFYRAEYRPVVGLAFALSGSRIAAEDIAQDAFLAAHREWERIGRYEKPGAWVRRVVSNLSVSLVRTRVRETKALARLKPRSSFIPRLPAEDEEFWKAVRALPTRQCQAVALHYLEDRSVADIAGILGCSESTVKVHLHKGRAGLARRLGLREEER